jgi:enamine deaminase RidA (YjgF/YER057c/UK114 family)
MKEVLSAGGAPAPAGPYSPGLIVGDWIFLSG